MPCTSKRLTFTLTLPTSSLMKMKHAGSLQKIYGLNDGVMFMLTMCILYSLQVTSLRTKVRQLFTPDYVTTMAAIYTMLQQDFTMQVS